MLITNLFAGQYATIAKVIVALVFIAAVSSGSGYLGYQLATAKYEKQHTADIQRLNEEQQKKLKEEQDRIIAMTNVLEAELKKNQILSRQYNDQVKKNKAIRVEVETNVKAELKKDIYNNCVVPDSGVSILRDTATRYNRERQANDSANPPSSVRPTPNP